MLPETVLPPASFVTLAADPSSSAKGVPPRGFDTVAGWVLSVTLEKSSDSEESVVPVVDVIGVEKLGMPRPAGAAFAAVLDDAPVDDFDDEVFAAGVFTVEFFEEAFAGEPCVVLDAAKVADAEGATGAAAGTTADAAGALAITGGKAVRLIATAGNFSSMTTFFETGARITIKATMNQKPSEIQPLWMSLFLSDSSIVFILSCAGSRR
jgi:hypothetical protein